MASSLASLYWDGRCACSVIYNFRTIGTNRWSGLAASAKNRTPAQRGRASASARLYFNGRAVVGSRKARRYVFGPVC